MTREYRSMLEAIFRYDPSKRPTASELLSYCHYMCLLGKNAREKLAVGVECNCSNFVQSSL